MTITTLSRAVAAGLLGSVAAIATAVPAQAEPTPRVRCAVGYVCLEPAGGAAPVAIPQGARRTFTPPMTVMGVTNLTRLTYCFTGSPNFALPPGGTVESLRRVAAAAPMPAGGACLT
jgi:hypothetical protein